MTTNGNMKKLFFVLFVCSPVLWFPGPLYGDDLGTAHSVTPALWRSELMGSSISPLPRGGSDPLGRFFLPHEGAETKRPIIAGSGGASVDGTGAGGSLGFLIPTLRGVWGGVTGIYADDTGTLWRGDVGVSRPIGHRVHGGASVTVQIATDGNRTDGGLGFNFGGAYYPAGVGGTNGLSFHGGIRNAGKSVRLDRDMEPVFPSFTPFAGVQFTLISTDAVSIGLAGSTALESFRYLSLDGSIAVHFDNGVRGSVGWYHRFGSGSDGLWPGLSLGVSIPLSSGKDADTRIHAAGQPDRRGSGVVTGGFSTQLPSIDSVPPLITVDVISPAVRGGKTGELGETIFLGPRPGIRELYIDLQLEDDRSAGEITAELIGPSGNTVQRRQFLPRETNVPQGSLAERLTSPLGQTTISGTLFWSVDAAEQDGFYRLAVTGRDGAGNTGTPQFFDILVDTQSPDLQLLTEEVYPDDTSQNVLLDEGLLEEGRSKGNGSKGRGEFLVRRNQRFSVDFRVRDAEQVSAYLVDEAGRQLFPLDLDVSSGADEDGYLLGTVVWNGVSPDGFRIAEGAYRIELVAFDFLGNRASLTGSPVVVEHEVPKLHLAVSGDLVAPTGNGPRETITLETRLTPVEGLKEWGISVIDAATGDITAAWSGIDLPPEKIVLDAAAFPRDGKYSIRGRSLYQNGTEATAPEQTVIADSSAPSIEIALSKRTVRPETGRDIEIYFEGDDEISQVRLYVEPVSSRGQERLQITDLKDDSVIAQFRELPDRYSWSFTGSKGTLLPPGMYRLWAEAEDAAGNVARSSSRDVILLERLEGVGILALKTIFSPGGIKNDTVILVPDGPSEEDGSFSVEIQDRTGTPVRLFRGSLPMPDQIEWNGRNNSGLVVQDGRYRPVLTVGVTGVEQMKAPGDWILVDTTAPQGRLAITGPSVVSPDGDGIQDELIFDLTIIGEDRWNDLSRKFFVSMAEDNGFQVLENVRVPELTPGENSWNLRQSDGLALPDGAYRVGVELADPAGNTTVLQSEPFRVDTRPITAFVRVNRGTVNPKGKPPIRTVTVSPVVSDVTGLQSWSLRIVDESLGQTVFEDTGKDGTVPVPVVWPVGSNGDLAGTHVSDGVYFAIFEASYDHGPSVRRESPRFRVDASGPEVTVTVIPQPFSPDGDGIDDVLSFFLEVRDASPIGYWYLEIFDSRGAFFYDVGAEGSPPDVIRWDGRARNGETVMSAEEYPWRLEVVDSLENVTVREGSLLVDILVEPYEGGYRMQVPSITFPPNSANLPVTGDDGGARKNREVLARVAEILARFPDYSVVVEGHAVNITGTEREEVEELQPLSRKRAEAVRSALIERGVSARVLTATGRGGTLPVVDHQDEQMRWKNRRVDFILQK